MLLLYLWAAPLYLCAVIEVTELSTTPSIHLHDYQLHIVLLSGYKRPYRMIA